MTTVYDVPPHDLIAAVAEELKAAGKVQPPEWAEFAKTGVNREMPPTNPDWWFVRCASVLRRIYIDGPVGVSRLRSFYGGKHRKGVATGFFCKGSGSVAKRVPAAAGEGRLREEAKERTPNDPRGSGIP